MQLASQCVNFTIVNVARLQFVVVRGLRHYVIDFDRFFPILHDKAAVRAAVDKTGANEQEERVQSPSRVQLISSMLII